MSAQGSGERAGRSLFWKVFMVVNLVAVVAMVAILVWAFFNIHERVGYLGLAQAPAILMMVIRRSFMPKGN